YRCKFNEDFKYILLPTAYGLVFLVGLVLNITAMYVILFRLKHWSPNTIYMINLAVCDTLYILTLPFLVYYYADKNVWPFSEPFCKLIRFLFYANLYGSILFLSCISLHRFLGVCHPVLGPCSGSVPRRAPAGFRVAVWVIVIVFQVVQTYSRTINTTILYLHPPALTVHSISSTGPTGHSDTPTLPPQSRYHVGGWIILTLPVDTGRGAGSFISDHRDLPHRTLPHRKAAPQDSAPQDAAPQDAAPQTLPHRTLPKGRCWLNSSGWLDDSFSPAVTLRCPGPLLLPNLGMLGIWSAMTHFRGTLQSLPDLQLRDLLPLLRGSLPGGAALQKEVGLKMIVIVPADLPCFVLPAFPPDPELLLLLPPTCRSASAAVLEGRSIIAYKVTRPSGQRQQLHRPILYFMAGQGFLRRS
ncbi:hypothetical protein NFI96_023791, partial [Prochilodus magdalenae]